MSLTLLKLVNNSDAGDADHVGGNDWDQMANTINTFESGATILLRRTDAAGNQAIELGPNHATGGASWIDFHTSSADGDYSARVIRNSGTDGLFNFLQSPTGGFKFSRSGSGLTTVGGAIDPLIKVFDVVTNTDATTAQDYITTQIFAAYQADDITDPFDLGCSVFQTELNYGVSPAARASGTAQANVVEIRVLGSGGTTPTSNEVGAYVGWFNMVAGETCSAWFTDWNLHGSVAVQPGELAGINMVVNNHYNGSPLRRASYGLCVATVQGQGGGLDAAHLAATSYKLDYGIAIQGYAGTIASPARGFEIALQIGGNNTNWMNPGAYNSKIGTGIRLTDIEAVGIDLDDPATSASSPAGIAVTTTTRTWDTFIDLSGGLAPTTNSIKLGQDRRILFSTIGLRDRGPDVLQIDGFTASTVLIIRMTSSYSTIASAANRVSMRLFSSTDTTNGEYLSLNSFGTSGFSIAADKGGTGTYRDLNLAGGGVNALTITSTPIVKALVAADFESYADYKVITIPADPASGYGRLYAKAVDANNDGLYVKLKINGAVTEVQVA